MWGSLRMIDLYLGMKKTMYEQTTSGESIDLSKAENWSFATEKLWPMLETLAFAFTSTSN